VSLDKGNCCSKQSPFFLSQGNQWYYMCVSELKDKDNGMHN